MLITKSVVSILCIVQSCSAAMASVARRSLATQLSRRMNQQEHENSIEVHRPLGHLPHFNLMKPQTHFMSKNHFIHSLMPITIAHCDRANDVDKPIIYSLNKLMFSMFHFIPETWTENNYEAILEIKDKSALLEAYSVCLLDFNYVPKMKRFYRSLLDMGPEVNDIFV